MKKHDDYRFPGITFGRIAELRQKEGVFDHIWWDAVRVWSSVSITRDENKNPVIDTMYVRDGKLWPDATIYQFTMLRPDDWKTATKHKFSVDDLPNRWKWRVPLYPGINGYVVTIVYTERKGGWYINIDEFLYDGKQVCVAPEYEDVLLRSEVVTSGIERALSNWYGESSIYQEVVDEAYDYCKELMNANEMTTGPLIVTKNDLPTSRSINSIPDCPFGIIPEAGAREQ